MASGDKIQGSVIMLYAWDTDAYKPIACIQSNDVGSSAEIKETRDKCNPGKVGKEYGSVNKTINIDAYYIDTTSVGGDTTKASHDWLEEKQDAKEKIDIKLNTGAETETYKYAKAMISDLNLTGPEGDPSTFTATLNIDGGWISDPHE